MLGHTVWGCIKSIKPWGKCVWQEVAGASRSCALRDRAPERGSGRSGLLSPRSANTAQEKSQVDWE